MLCSPRRNGMPPPESFSDMSRAVLRMRLLFDGEPVQVASAMHDVSRGMFGSVSQHAGDAAVLFVLQLNAEQEEAEDETQMSYNRKALDDIIAFRREADKAFAAGEDEPARTTLPRRPLAAASVVNSYSRMLAPVACCISQRR